MRRDASRLRRLAPWIAIAGVVALLAWAGAGLSPSDPETVRADGSQERHGSDHGSPEAGPSREEAARLVADTRSEAERFESVEAAEEEGYERVERGGPGEPVHFVNMKYALDGETLDPQRPESLVYRAGPDGGMERLLGVMYLAPAGRGPAIGEIARWHTHDDLCYDVRTGGISSRDGGCPEGTIPGEKVEMMHVWLFDHPDGPFAQHPVSGTRAHEGHRH